MIKRPALGIFLAFLIGLLSYESGLVFPVIIVVSGMFFLVFILIKNNLLSVSDYILPAKKKYVWIFLLLLVIAYVTGYFRCFFYERDTENGRMPYLIMHENKETKVVVTGLVSDMTLEGEKYKILLTDCMIKGFEEDVWRKAGGCFVYLGVESKSVDEEQNITYPKNLRIGQRIKVYGSFFLHEKATNPGQFDSFQYNLRYKSYAGISAKSFWIVDEQCNKAGFWRLVIKNRVQEALKFVYSEKDAGVLYAMLTGEKSLLDKEIQDSYRKAGVSHILAISGLHITLICMGFFRVLRKIHCPVRLNYLISVIFIVLYCLFTGGSVCAVRASIMSITLILAYASRHKYDLLSALAVSAIITLFVFPFEYKEAGFLLSYTAMVGVYIGGELDVDILGGTIITLMTLPVSLYFFYEFSPYGVLSNILILPLTGCILSGGLFSAVFGAVFRPLGLLTGGITTLGLRFVEYFTNRINMLPFSYVLTGKPKVAEVIFYYAALFLLLNVWKTVKTRKKKTKEQIKRNKFNLIKGVLAAVLFCFSLGALLLPNKSDSLAFLDVGQGDSGVLIKDGECVLFDAGSSSVKNIGEYRVAPYLKYNGVGLIDTVTLSHTDEDHYSGILELLTNMKPFYSDILYKMDYDGNIGIKRLVLPEVYEKNEAYEVLETLAKEKNVEVIYMKAGSDLDTDMENIKIRCLWPNNAKTSENETSLVFLLELPRYLIYFMGDANQAAEKQIIKNLPEITDISTKTVILKVGHHGSKTSTSSDFLNSIRPDIAIISCGYNNSYGHPHGAVLDELINKNIEIRRTDKEGCISFLINN